MHRGYIKLWRKIEDSFIMRDPDALWLWIKLLMKANHKDTEFMFNGSKVVLKRGQLITGRKALSNESTVSESKIFRLLKCFEIEHLIEQQKTNRYSIVSIVSYDDYQFNEHQNEQLVNNQRTTSEQPVNTSKELLSTKDPLINIKRVVFTPPSLQEVIVYCLERKNGIDSQKWHNFYTAKDWMIGKNKMKDWKAAVRTWEKDYTKKEGTEHSQNDARDVWQKMANKLCSNCRGEGAIYAPGSGKYGKCGCVK